MEPVAPRAQQHAPQGMTIDITPIWLTCRSTTRRHRRQTGAGHPPADAAGAGRCAAVRLSRIQLFACAGTENAPTGPRASRITGAAVGKPAAIVGAGGGMGTSRAIPFTSGGRISRLAFRQQAGSIPATPFPEGFDANGQLQDDRIKQADRPATGCVAGIGVTLR